MNERPDLGLEAVRRIAKLWLVESDRVRWVEDGFDWWPGRFRVSVRSFKRPDETDGPVWRLTVRTAFLKDVPWHPENTWRAFFLMANLSPTYAWVYMPVELAKLGDKRGIIEEWQDAFADRLVWFQSTVYLRQENAEWLPEFFGQITILQPIEAEWLADTAAQRLGGRPDVTRISETAPRQLDGILDVARTIYVPAGERVSRWEGSEEFAEVAEQFGTFEYCFGVRIQRAWSLKPPLARLPRGYSSTLTCRIFISGRAWRLPSYSLSGETGRPQRMNACGLIFWSRSRGGTFAFLNSGRGLHRKAMMVCSSPATCFLYRTHSIDRVSRATLQFGSFGTPFG
jgi:hypothetical protein